MSTASATCTPRQRAVGAMLSHVGRVRSSNEDTAIFVAPSEGTPESRVGFLALVADGMGGHAAGEVASALAADTIRRVVYSSRGSPSDLLRDAFAAANRAILEHSAANPATRGMGTTCTAMLVQDDVLWLAHIGDSRAYWLRDGVLEQLSQDQTLHAQLVRDGVMTLEEAERSPGKNFLLQALGAREELAPQLSTQGRMLRPGDILVLCSDGLYGHVSDAEIARIVAARAPQEACRELIDAALAGGGSDNVSVGVFRVEDAGRTQVGEQAATKPIRVVEAEESSSGIED